MDKFHNSPTAGTQPCTASVKDCPIGKNGGEHFYDRKEAEAAFQQSQEAEHGVFATVKNVDKKALGNLKSRMKVLQEEADESKARMEALTEAEKLMANGDDLSEPQRSILHEAGVSENRSNFSNRDGIMNSDHKTIAGIIKRGKEQELDENALIEYRIADANARISAKENNQLFDESKSLTVARFIEKDQWGAESDRLEFTRASERAKALMKGFKTKRLLSQYKKVANNINEFDKDLKERIFYSQDKNELKGVVQDAEEKYSAKLKANDDVAEFIVKPTSENEKFEDGSWKPNSFHATVIDPNDQYTDRTGSKNKISEGFITMHGASNYSAVLEKSYNEAVQFGWIEDDGISATVTSRGKKALGKLKALDE